MKNEKENIKICLLYLKDFFNNKKNLKIKHIFYIILRIHLIYINSLFYDSLHYVNKMIDEKASNKIKGLKLIKNEIEENIDKIEINANTVLTLKEDKFKFKPLDYYGLSDLQKPFIIINNIVNKNKMTFDYCLKNKFNIFDYDSQIQAFLNIIKKILSSRVIKEYYKNTTFFQSSEFPLDNEKIINYFLNKIIFIKLPSKYWGYTS